MSASFIALCIWIVAGSITAFVPMRFQIIPGLLLILSGFGLIVWMGAENGWIWSVVALAIFASLFRRPLIALYRHARGKPGDIPKD